MNLTTDHSMMSHLGDLSRTSRGAEGGMNCESLASNPEVKKRCERLVV